MKNGTHWHKANHDVKIEVDIMGFDEKTLEETCTKYGLKKEEVQAVYDQKLKDVKFQLSSLTDADASQLAGRQTMVYFKKRLLRINSVKKYVVLGQLKAPRDFAKEYLVALNRDVLSKISSDEAKKASYLDANGKKIYQSIPGVLEVPAWKVNSPVPASDLMATYVLITKDNTPMEYVAKTTATMDLLNANQYAVIEADVVEGKKVPRVYEQDKPQVISKLSESEIEQLHSMVLSKYDMNGEKLMSAVKVKTYEYCTLSGLVMSISLGTETISPSVSLDVAGIDDYAINVYFPKNTAMRIVDGAPITIFGKTGSINEKKKVIYVNAAYYSIDKKFVPNVIIKKIEDVEALRTADNDVEQLM